MNPAASPKATMTTTETPTRTPWAWLTGTFFGVGLLPGGPGTWAALATTVIWYFAARGAHATSGWLSIATLIAAVAVTLIGVPAASVVERESGRQDPGHVVIDEVAGQLFALIFAPLDAGHAALAFVLFRIFDIWKPQPVRRLERLHGGLGIMMDDVAAGVYALIIVLIVHHWW